MLPDRFQTGRGWACRIIRFVRYSKGIRHIRQAAKATTARDSHQMAGRIAPRVERPRRRIYCLVGAPRRTLVTDIARAGVSVGPLGRIKTFIGRLINVGYTVEGTL